MQFKEKQGFTLVEMLIAMTVFLIFIGVVMNSYFGIVRSMHEANEYRIMYAEARHVFDRLSDEIRNSAIIYYEAVSYQSGIDKLRLMATDGSYQKTFEYDGENLVLSDGEFESEPYQLNSDEVKISDLKFYVSPAKDPYNPQNTAASNLQFQPKVTITATFVRELSGNKTYSFELQTTVSSRFYSQSITEETTI